MGSFALLLAPRPPAVSPAGIGVPATPADLALHWSQLQLQLCLPALPDQPQLHAVERPGEEPSPGGHADAVAAHGEGELLRAAGVSLVALRQLGP